ncbi:MAG TPA: hypothetical protein VGH80_06955 [Xanthomonadaceae bacterium]
MEFQGEKEVWQLVWDRPPEEVCGPHDMIGAISCPCSGLSYGEFGTLRLIRKRGNVQIDSLDLRPLFGQFDYPDANRVEGTAYLQRWPTLEGDFDRERRGDSALVDEIEHRQPVNLMQLADYDRDGRATEFLMQVGTLPCGNTQFAALGVSPLNPRLHALTSVGKPGKPLMMPRDAWEALLRPGSPATVTTLTCGDHGSDVQEELVVSANHGEIQVRQRVYACTPDGDKGRLRSDTSF